MTAIVSTLGTVAVAVISNRKERRNAAEASVEDALRERITLRDERNEHLHAQNVRLQTELDECISENLRLKGKKG